MPNFVNIAAYKFVQLDDIAELKSRLLPFCRELGMRGTILLSSEGINMFLAGTREAIDSFLEYLRGDERFSDIPVKESFCDHQPFSRMLVRLKNEIISMGVPTIRPERETSPKISATELRSWLNEGKELTLLDVRNDYEYNLGTFDDAVPIRVDSFREFPEAVEKLPEEMKKKPVVMFCTGGIRCEKAGPLMEGKGFSEVYQLDGGILKYFEDCGGDHYQGECFVFDKRVALDSDLSETETEQCYICQAIVTYDEQQYDEYVPGKSCHYCYQTPEEKMLATILQRTHQLKVATTPLPGSEPYDNQRPMNVPLRFDQSTVIELLNGVHPHVGDDYWRQEIELGRITYQEQPLAANDVVTAGWRVEHLVPQTVEPDVSNEIEVLYEDECMVVVNKPAPLPMHPSGRFNRNTLKMMLSLVYPGQRLRLAHRLDANTTGVVVICRKRTAADFMRVQFEKGEVNKTYLALVDGHPEQDSFRCDAAISSSPDHGGGRRVAEDGQPAATEFESLHRAENGTALIRCKPITGRTNQIRVHLAHLGFPIVGDPMYAADGEIRHQQTKNVGDPPMCLHAWKIDFKSPMTGDPISLVAPTPEWFPVELG